MAGQVLVALPLDVLSRLNLDMPLPAEAARVIAEGQVDRAAKGWAVAILSASLQSAGWPQAVEVYTRRGARSDAVYTFAFAEDPYTRGSGLGAALGQVCGLHELTDMLPQMFFSGGDLRQGWHGWMEGTVTSGSDVATRTMAHARDDNAPPTTGQRLRVRGSRRVTWLKGVCRRCSMKQNGRHSRLKSRPPTSVPNE